MLLHRVYVYHFSSSLYALLDLLPNEPPFSLNPAVLFDRCTVEFSPVFTCLQIYEHLNIASEFQDYYKEVRKTQARQAFEYHGETSDFIEQASMKYFARIAGFFIVENATVNSPNDLLSREELDIQWQLAVSNIKIVLHNQFEAQEDSQVLLGLRYTVILFARTLESYGFDTMALLDFLASQRDTFEEISTLQLERAVRQIMEAEKYEPFQISSQNDFDRYVARYGLQGANPAPKSFPTSMEFSSSVCKICAAMKLFISDYFEWSTYLKKDIQMSIFKSIDTALIRVVNGALLRVVDDSSTRLVISQAVQLAINAGYLKVACDYFEAYASSYCENRYPARANLSARDSFVDTRAKCEGVLFELVSEKIDSFLSLAYDEKWYVVCRVCVWDVYFQPLLLDIGAYLHTGAVCLFSTVSERPLTLSPLHAPSFVYISLTLSLSRSISLYLSLPLCSTQDTL